MKNAQIIILILTILVCNSCKDKNDDIKLKKDIIPNAQLETWVQDNLYEKPESWNTSNFSLYGIINLNPVNKDSSAPYEGKYCAKLSTEGTIIDNQPVKIIGLITLGSFDVNISTKQAKVSGGIPFKSKPLALEGYYKYEGVGIDSCFVVIAITKFNKQTLKQDTVAYGLFSSSSVSTWTHFSLPINYFSKEQPDSMNIIILSSDTSIFEQGSTMWVDNLSLKYQ